MGRRILSGEVGRVFVRIDAVELETTDGFEALKPTDGLKER